MTDYADQTVRIVDLAEDTNELVGLEFERCEIRGPAVILPLNSRFARCEFGSLGGEPGSVIWEIDEARIQTAQGAIRLLDCSFEDCKFVRVGVGLVPPAAREFREALAEASAPVRPEAATPVAP